MSSVLHPVGPERRTTYWRRRLLAVLVLLLVVVAAVLGVRALGAGADDGQPAAQRLDPQRVSPTVAAATDSPTTSPSTSPTTSSTAAAGEPSTCAATALSVVLTSDVPAYGPGRTPKFTITVQNTSETACTVEVGSGVRTFAASDSAGNRVWSTVDCQSSTASQISTLAPGETASMPTTWSRQRSAAGCPAGQAVVDAGTYTVDATWNGVPTGTVNVVLTN